MTGANQRSAETDANERSPASTAEEDPSGVLIAEFAERATALGVSVERLAGNHEAAEAIGRVLAEVGASRIVIANELAKAAPELTVSLGRAGIGWERPGEPADLQHEQIGASMGQLAIAETGSVMLAEPDLPDRAIGMLVSVHVILCRSESIVPSLDDASSVLRELALRPAGAYATLVTGPSRTADIERVLTVGVQGPGRVLVFFVDELT